MTIISTRLFEPGGEILVKAKKASYICSQCGEITARWAGKCDSCGSWNTIEEYTSSAVNISNTKANLDSLPTLDSIAADEAIRKTTGIADLDLVLGGGLVPGCFLLIAGEPGAGKSTLMLEISRNFPGKLYYFSGEESPAQIKLRANRMKLSGQRVFLSRETSIETICSRILKEKPDLVIIDSIQTIHTGGSIPGSVSQLRDASMALLEAAKTARVPVLVTGHITKEGTVAGPRILEHMVDGVLYFESDRLNHYRILRAIKNRFGPVGEVSIFEMVESGLSSVEAFPFAEKQSGSGCVFSAYCEGSRSIAVEVQALVSRAAYGPSRRMAEGLDNRRLILLAAVLEKYLKLNLAECDIFANLAGGLSADEPALDLALAMAILSSYRERSVRKQTAYLGEVGLGGEIRPVARINSRVKELSNLGFDTFILPESSNDLSLDTTMRCVKVQHIKDLLNDSFFDT